MIDKFQITSIVLNHFGLDYEDVFSTKRDKKYVIPRQFIMYLLMKNTKTTLCEIRDFVKKKNHTTIIYGIKVIENIQDYDVAMKRDLANLNLKIFYKITENEHALLKELKNEHN